MCSSDLGGPLTPTSPSLEHSSFVMDANKDLVTGEFPWQQAYSAVPSPLWAEHDLLSGALLWLPGAVAGGKVQGSGLTQYHWPVMGDPQHTCDGTTEVCG